jgi:hypothetical protein
MAETCISCNHDCHCADDGICNCEVGIGVSDKSQLCECTNCKCKVAYPDWG